MLVTYSPGCGLVISRSLASFASICTISTESAGFAFALSTSAGLFGSAAGGAAKEGKPVTATVVTRNAALIFNLVVHMAFKTPSVQEDSFQNGHVHRTSLSLFCFHDDSAF